MLTIEGVSRIGFGSHLFLGSCPDKHKMCALLGDSCSWPIPSSHPYSPPPIKRSLLYDLQLGQVSEARVLSKLIHSE